MFHYAKRAVESLFVHRFGENNMSMSTAVYMAAYYWILGGALLAGSVLSDDYVAPKFGHPLVFWSLVGTFLGAEVKNGQCHRVLKNLRPKEGSVVKQIPKVPSEE